MNERDENDACTPAIVNDETLDTFHEDGFVILPNLLPTTTLQSWQDFAQKSHGGMDFVSWIFHELRSRGHTAFPEEKKDEQYALGHGVKNGFCEIVSRSPGRYEISLLNLQKHADKLESPPPLNHLLDLLEDAKIHSLLSQSTWKDNVRVINTSLIISTPDSSTQGWHADGGHINLQEHLPCHVLNVFIPLQDMTDELGPTQLRPGTHVYTRNLGPMMLAAKCRKTLRPPVTPLLKAGDALCFDYRILHRGLANTSSNNTHRIMLCVTVAQNWYNDLLNFPKRSMFASKQEELRNQALPSKEIADEKTEERPRNESQSTSTSPASLKPNNSEDLSEPKIETQSTASEVDNKGDRTRKSAGVTTGVPSAKGPGPFDEAPCIHFATRMPKCHRILQEYRTPQYIATLQSQIENAATAERPSEASSQSLAPIMIASDNDEATKILVQPLGKGRVALWNTSRIMQSWKESEEKNYLFNNLLKADVILDAKQRKSVSWLEFVQVPSSILQRVGQKPTLHLLGLLSTGTVFLFSIDADLPSPKKEDSAATSESHYRILTNWQMGEGRVTCMGITTSGVVLVGDEKGNIFASHLQQRSRSNVTVSPVWEGSFDHGYPIKSILQLPTHEEESHSADPNNKIFDECVAVTVQPGSRVASPSQLEVINISAISRSVETSMTKDDIQKNSKATGKARAPAIIDERKEAKTNADVRIPLQDFWVLPEPGWELVDAAMIKERGSSTSRSLSIRTIHWVPTQGSHRLYGPVGGSKIALTLSDGTGVFISVKKQEDGQISWGVANGEKDQWLMSYPGIGMGHVQLRDNHNSEDSCQPHLACALRGGTAYLIPISKCTSKDPSDLESYVKVISYPHDIENDTPRQSLQSFTASNIVLDENRDVPILFFAWPGGIIDLYACHLMNNAFHKEQQGAAQHLPVKDENDEAIRELVSNGAASNLKDLLDKVSQKLLAAELVKDENESFDWPIWRKAARELMEVQDPEFTTSNLQQWPSFRSLLLLLSDPSYNFERTMDSLKTMM